MITFNIIGAGRLGKNIAYALTTSGLGQLTAVCNHQLSSAKQAIELIGMGEAVENLTDLPPAELTFITTADDLITPIAAQLAQNFLIKKGSIVAHCSGVLTTAALMPLKTLNCQLGSIHPLKAFKQGLHPDSFKQCDCVIEGEAFAVKELTTLFQSLGAKLIALPAASKVLYHTAATMASNYLVTLAATTTELLKACGIEAGLAQQMIVRLMSGSLANVQQAKDIKQALTGPLTRGDLDTVNKHLQVLDSKSDHPSLTAIYRKFGIATLALTDLDETKKQAILAALIT